jgi:predicted glutamine amidotransferase
MQSEPVAFIPFLTTYSVSKLNKPNDTSKKETDGTEHAHTIPTPIVFAVEPLTPKNPWLLIHPADINLFQVYEDRRLRPDQSTKHAEVYHMNAYTIINSTPRIILPVNMIALDNLRGTIVSLDRFYDVEVKNGPPHLHHIVTDRVGRTHDLCSARYVERDSYHVNSYDSHRESRGKIVATEGVVPFPEEVEFYSFYFRKDGTGPIYSNPPEIRICSVPRTQKSLKGKDAEIVRLLANSLAKISITNIVISSRGLDATKISHLPTPTPFDTHCAGNNPSSLR